MSASEHPSAYSRNQVGIDFETDLGPLKTSGTVPPELSGMLVRNGPNPFLQNPGQHWFLGDGMLHAFYFSSGEVRYRNRWVRTASWRAEQEQGKNPVAGFLPEADGAHDDGVANTNIVWHAGRLLALEEAHLPLAMQAADLATLGSTDYGGALSGPFTAHPKIDAASGEMLFFGYGTPDFLTSGMAYGTMDRTGRVTRFERFQAPYAAMVHDFAATRGHVLFPIMPLTASLERARSGRPPFAWEPEYGTRIGVLARDRHVDSIEWWNGPSCYVYHVMNAWEEEDTIHADVMQAAAPALFPWPDGRPVEGGGGSRLCRWSFDLKGRERSYRQEWLCDIPGEFPRIDDRFAGLANRHGWFVGSVADDPARAFSRIVHVDHGSGRQAAYDLPLGDASSEAVFVPRSADAAEGEGWLLAVVFRGAEQRSDMIVLDALAVGAGPVATIMLPHRVPNGFHGNWIGAEELARGAH